MVSLKKVHAVFYRSALGTEPVLDFLRDLSREDRRLVGSYIATVEYGCGRWEKPTCALGSGLWEVRSTLTGNRIARVLFILLEGQMVLLHSFVKKTQKTPKGDLDIARKRIKEVTG